MSTVNIGSLGNAQAIGWADAQITRAGAGQLAFSTTWNDAGTTFAGLRMNVTDTASNSGSSLMDLRVGGVTQFRVAKNGQVSAVSYSGVDGGFSAIAFHGSVSSSANGAVRDGIGFVTRANSAYSWVSNTNAGSGTIDLSLARDAANTLALRNGTNAQAFRLYGTFTDASNHRRLVATMSTSGVAEIKPEGAGTGVDGNVLHISGLPTANPGPGILWNDGGTPAIGT